MRDRTVLGALVGCLAGLVSLTIVLLWGLLSRLGHAPPALAPLLRLHLLYLLAYAVCGAAIGALWPARKRRGGALGLWVIASAATTLSIASLSAGPAWRWSLPLWGKYVAATVAFAVVFSWPERRQRNAG